MSVSKVRKRSVPLIMDVPKPVVEGDLAKAQAIQSTFNFGNRIQVTESEGHPINRKTGKYDSGGSFFTTRYGPFIKPAHVYRACSVQVGVPDKFYTGPVLTPDYNGTERASLGFVGGPGTINQSQMAADGATAVSQSAPTNPTANLGTTLAESFREGVPSLPGIQSWKRRASIAKNAGSEYLNYQFGWAPLASEIHSVVRTSRHHRDILQNYRHGEGRNTHRRFDFPLDITRKEVEIPPAYGLTGMNSTYIPSSSSAPSRTCSLVRERRRWFEGCFTYGGPSKIDSFGRAIGYGSDADALYGLALTPDVLWELTPWSWAVDWFTNAGDVISNISAFATAGLVMRYGYMMEESIETVSVNSGPEYLRNKQSKGHYGTVEVGPNSRGFETVTKRRVPANPFGFGIGWEGLSPTQLAITAALGITRAL
uniref:Uncharacterized protein n=1 Tax=Leviviridae sp. TaxID=2027243 RepID=A0A514D7F7_9VIRU|nr:MAG: hypothetical protein H4Rhizo43412_000004 [Leviviridae sp.]